MLNLYANALLFSSFYHLRLSVKLYVLCRYVSNVQLTLPCNLISNHAKSSLYLDFFSCDNKVTVRSLTRRRFQSPVFRVRQSSAFLPGSRRLDGRSKPTIIFPIAVRPHVTRHNDTRSRRFESHRHLPAVDTFIASVTFFWYTFVDVFSNVVGQRKDCIAINILHKLFLQNPTVRIHLIYCPSPTLNPS